jgi:hypothetical protein
MALIGDTDLKSASSTMFDLDAKGYAAEWQSQQAMYALVWKYFSGKIFDERRTDTKGGKPGDLLYPLRVNSVKQACLTHTLHLWGLTSEAPILGFTVKPKSDNTDTSTDRAERLRRLFFTLFNAEAMPARLREAGRLFNALGGAALKVRRDEQAQLGVVIDNIPVSYFYPVWNPTDYEQLLRVHIAFWIPTEIAVLLYGYNARQPAASEVEYVETWDLNSWTITVGTPGHRQQAVDSATGLPLSGPNTFVNPITKRRYIPIVYIPRLRTGRYWGDSLIEDLRGLQDEFNGRLADQGDAVSASSHMHAWGRNLNRRRDPGPLLLPTGNRIFDAGELQVGGGEPLLDNLTGPSLTDSVANFSSQVEDLIWDQASVAPVVRGLDEGSQRSGVTLTARALPTVSITDDYRDSWRAGVLRLIELFLCCCYAEGEENQGLNDVSHLDFGHQIGVDFAPRLPRDVDQINNTIQVQRSAGVMSVTRALVLSPDVDNVELELAEIQEERKEKAQQAMEIVQTQAKARAAQAPPRAAQASKQAPARASTGRGAGARESSSDK